MGIRSCNRHPTVAAAIHCSQCHKPICEKCIVNGRFCSPACDQKFSQFYSGYKDRGIKNTTPFMRFVYTILSLAFLAGGGYAIVKYVLPMLK